MMCNYLADKKRRYVKILVAVLLVFSPVSNAVWEDISPTIGNVTDFALTPDKPATVLATTAVGGNQGIWTSSNSGANWSQQFFNRDYHGAAIKADSFVSMLAGVSGEMIDISANGGATWAVTAGSENNATWIIEYSLSTEDTVYAAGYTSASSSGTLQKSTNAGNNWASFAVGGDANPALFSLAIDPTDADTVYVGAQPDAASNGLYKTTDGAISWSYLPDLNITRVDAIAVDRVNPDYVYAGTGGSGLIQRSVDGGDNWVILHDPNDGGVAGFTRVLGLVINPADRRIIYAVGGSGTTKAIVSTDCGASWANVGDPGLISGLPDKVLINPDPDPVSGNLVMVKTTNGFMYREDLLTNATGDCNPNTGTSSSGGSSSGSFDHLLLGMLMLIGVVRYSASRLLRS